jgi:hypothetical protein
MPTSSLSEADKKSTEKLSNWDTAIQDAEILIKRLQASIRTYQKMRDLGQPWPEFPSTQN